VKLTYQELSNNPGSFLAKAANGAKGAVCGAYRDYKDWYHSNIDLASPAGLLVEQLWDNLCPMEPHYSPPPPPPPAFNGGQCSCVLYYVNYSFGIKGFEQYPNSTGRNQLWGPILGIRPAFVDDSSAIQILCKGPFWRGCDDSISWVTVYGNPGPEKTPIRLSITSVTRCDGQPDTCGNPPSDAPAPIIAPPTRINRDITIDNDGVPLTIPFSFNPQFNLPGLSISGNFNYFNPSFNFNVAPQFNIAPSAKLDFKPDININFDLDGVNLNIGGSQDNDDITNFNHNKNINNINNNTSNTNNNINNINNTINNIENQTDKTNDDVTIIKDKLACNPCDLLEEIKEKLDYVPTYESHFISEFQSIKLDNLANLGYIEIDVTVFPNKTKVIYGGNAPNVLFSGWITWRKNGYNFSREQVTAQSSIYYAPKGANGFSICCTHNSRASCLYYIEIKD
jgi:hypothetical protein